MEGDAGTSQLNPTDAHDSHIEPLSEATDETTAAQTDAPTRGGRRTRRYPPGREAWERCRPGLVPRADALGGGHGGRRILRPVRS